MNYTFRKRLIYWLASEIVGIAKDTINVYEHLQSSNKNAIMLDCILVLSSTITFSIFLPFLELILSKLTTIDKFLREEPCFF